MAVLEAVSYTFFFLITFHQDSDELVRHQIIVQNIFKHFN